VCGHGAAGTTAANGVPGRSSLIDHCSNGRRAGGAKIVIDGRFVTDDSDLHRRPAGRFGYGPWHPGEL
jgi:hypothetical protein